MDGRLDRRLAVPAVGHGLIGITALRVTTQLVGTACFVRGSFQRASLESNGSKVGFLGCDLADARYQLRLED